jgi:hypothetical protein
VTMASVSPSEPSNSPQRFLRCVLLAFALIAAMLVRPAAACTVSASVSSTLGTYSPAAVKAKAVPAIRSRAGLQCNSALLVLLSDDNMKAKFTSQNGLKLLAVSGGGSISYKASADPGGTVVFSQNSTIDYLQNNLLNLLGLVGSSSADLPFFITPNEASFPPEGVYKDKVTIFWSWKICPSGISLLGACVGGADSGTGTAVIDVTLNVGAQNATITISSTSTWDPVSGTSRPKALPGAKRRVTMTVINPDIVPLDVGAVIVVVPTPVGTAVALDGDGASGGAAIAMAEGSPASTLAMRYSGPGDMTDDVDFSSDAGQSWSYVPIAGNVASQSAVTQVRIRARGTMAKQSTFSVSVPYLIR